MDIIAQRLGLYPVELRLKNLVRKGEEIKPNGKPPDADLFRKRRIAMEKPRIRHIAINVANREKTAEYYKKVFQMKEKYRGPSGTIYLSDGHLDVALISTDKYPWGINHFGFKVDSVKGIEETAQTTAQANTFGAVAESWIRDIEGNRVDVSEHGWPI